eukprot:TRINITY_DN1302_c0_g1_i1.p1 TRINITY_DN1302_c0_g1~~TRINITY_DN1302_c0_g1_i1.p1  ORF type:complete len:277 (-),score=95.60 TRINITY_DN1302_c0_g1_i1:173-1003(-)
MAWRRVAILFLMLEAVRAQGDIPEDMGCEKGKHAAVWLSVKKSFRTLIDETSGPFSPVKNEAIKTVVDNAVAQVKAAGGFEKAAEGECGLGRLSIQLLTLATLTDPQAAAQSLQELQAISSPVLTLLLDVPWVATALSGWPMFGILAQVGLHKVQVLQGMLNNDALDGLQRDIDKAYFQEINTAASKGDLISMVESSVKYMSSGGEGGGILAPLTAMASQAAVQTEVQQRMEAATQLQNAFRGVIGTPAELDLSLTTRWPLWGLVHVTVGAFTAAA